MPSPPVVPPTVNDEEDDPATTLSGTSTPSLPPTSTVGKGKHFFHSNNMPHILIQRGTDKPSRRELTTDDPQERC